MRVSVPYSLNSPFALVSPTPVHPGLLKPTTGARTRVTWPHFPPSPPLARTQDRESAHSRALVALHTPKQEEPGDEQVKGHGPENVPAVLSRPHPGMRPLKIALM